MTQQNILTSLQGFKATSATSKHYYSNVNLVNKLNPFLVSGFADGESSFMVSICQDKNYKSGFHVQLTFVIALHKKDRILLDLFRQIFGGIGGITKQREDSIQFRVS